MRSIALLTDFGLQDHYIGVVHAVLEDEAAGVTRVDLCHEVPPGDVWTGAFLLRCSWQYLPQNAVVLAVVDPGVGSTRAAVMAEVDGRWIVGPDNGLVSAVGRPQRAFEIVLRSEAERTVSSTFHGRDVFAPAAARLARGDEATSFGSEIDPSSLVECPLPEPVISDSGISGVVLHIDRFGNVVTNLPARIVPDDALTKLGAVEVARRVTYYSEAPAGVPVVLEGSSGLIEIAIADDSAAARLGVERGAKVVVRFQ